MAHSRQPAGLGAGSPQGAATIRNTEQRTSLYQSTELKILVAATMGMSILLFALSSFVLQRSDYLMLDFEKWTLVSSSADPTPKQEVQYFESIQTKKLAQRPFRAVLRLPKDTSQGDFLALEQVLSVESNTNYCFQVYIFRPHYRQESDAATKPLALVLSINDRTVRNLPMADLHGEILVIDKIRTELDRIKIRIEVRANQPCVGKACLDASTVELEFATLRRCRDIPSDTFPEMD